MVQNLRPDAANSARELNNYPRHPARASQAKAGLQMILLLDSETWRATRGAPFQFARWIGALVTVVANWVQSGTPPSAAAYVPVLAVVALLLLPDAQSIEIPGLKFDRLSNEITRQRHSVDRLSAEDSSQPTGLPKETEGPSDADHQPPAAVSQVEAAYGPMT